MALLGLLIILATGGFAAGVLYSGDNTGVNVVVFGTNGRTTSLAMFFLLGSLTGIAFAIGVGLFLSGLGRRRARRQEVSAAETRRLDEEESLRARNDELERRIDLTRAAERRRAELSSNGANSTAASYDAYPDEPITADEDVTSGGRHRRR